MTLARHSRAGRDGAWQGWRGIAKRGLSRPSWARHGWHGMARFGPAERCVAASRGSGAWQGWPGEAERGLAGRGKTNHVRARRVWAKQGRQCVSSHSGAKCGWSPAAPDVARLAWHGVAEPDLARRVLAGHQRGKAGWSWRGPSGQGKAQRGHARHFLGMVGHVLGMAWQGWHGGS